MWNKLKEKFLNKQFLSFGLIGLLNTFISSVVLYPIFVNMKIEVGIASVLADVLTMVISYFLNITITYHQKPSLKTAISFPLSYIPGICISALITLLVVHVFNGPELWAKAIAIPIYVPVNYLCMSFVVKRFGKHDLNSAIQKQEKQA